MSLTLEQAFKARNKTILWLNETKAWQIRYPKFDAISVILETGVYSLCFGQDCLTELNNTRSST